jgi:hypothetical protein
MNGDGELRNKPARAVPSASTRQRREEKKVFYKEKRALRGVHAQRAAAALSLVLLF